MAVPAPITSISKLCRMCLAAISGGHSLYELLDVEAEDSPSIAEAAHKVLGCELVEDEEYPSTICCICKRNLRNAFYFQMIVVRSQEVLGEVFDDIKDVRNKFSHCKSSAVSLNRKKSNPETFLLREASFEEPEPALPAKQLLLGSQKTLEEAVDSKSAEPQTDLVGADEVVEGEETEDVTNFDEGEQEVSYWCHLCELVLVGESSLEEHIAEHVRVNTDQTETQDTTKPKTLGNCEMFICDICDQKFKSKHTYCNHLKFHGVQNLKKCDQCDKAFHKASLLRHKKNAHQNSDTACNVRIE